MPQTKSLTTSLAWLAVGTLILALGIAVPEIGLPGTWCAMALLLGGWRALPTRRGLPALWLAFYAGLGLGTRGQMPVRGPVLFVMLGVMATFAVVPFLVERLAGRRLDGVAATLVFPAALVAEEFLRSRIPGGSATWGALGYTQYGFLPLMQLASVTGVWGITFLIGWFASVAAWAWERDMDWSVVRPIVTTHAAVAATIVVLGAARLALPSPASSTVRAAVVTFPTQLFSPGEMFRVQDGRLPVEGEVAARVARLQDWFFDSTAREARAGATLVAWPEGNFLVRTEDEPAALERARALAAREHVFLSMGIGAVQAGARRPFQNKTVLLDPAGQVVYSYLKSRPVIGWEQAVMQRGDGRLPVMPTALGRVGTAICFDGDHPDLIRQVGIGGTDLTILPVNDWADIEHVHFAMAAFRAVENGTPLLRPASGGISGAFDARGRVLARADHVAGATSMVAEIPVGGEPTIYSRVGDVFAWTCVLGCALAPFLARVRVSGAAPTAAVIAGR